MIVISLSSLSEKIVSLINEKNKIVELRLDMILSSVNVKDFFKFLSEVRKNIKVPLILTCRKKEVGGYFNGSEQKRFLLIQKFLKIGFEYIDLEMDCPDYFFSKIKAKYPNIKIITSFHDLEKNPEDLESIFSNMLTKQADIYKLATFASSALDSLKMVSFIQKKASLGYKICGMCMGEYGVFTRIMSPIVGGFFSYASLDVNTALGQIDADTMERRYGYSKLNRSTSIYALLGEKVSSSFSHITHNKIFSLDNFKNIYLKIPIKKEEFLSVFPYFSDLPFKGFSITTPFKEKVLSMLCKIDNEPYFIEAVNTLKKKEGGWIGFNTDGVGAIKALEKRGSLFNKKIVVIGAGATARAICLEAKKRGAKVILINRTEEKAKAWAKKLGIEGEELDYIKNLYLEGYDILINATTSLDPLEKKYFLKDAVFMDVNSNPQWTDFLIKANEKGAKVIFGFEMFVYQAEKQFEFFFDFCY